MYKKILLLSGVMVFTALFCGVAALAAAPPLLSTQWLADHLDDQNMVIIDVRTATNYGVGHIPGSVNLPYKVWETLDSAKQCKLMLPPKEMSAILRKNGLSANSHVVVYDHGNTISDATKGATTIWILAAMGKKNVSYLNGGFTKWTFEGRIIDNIKPKVSPGNFQENFDVSKVTDITDLVSKMQSGKILLVDARNSNQHFGTKKRSDVGRYGHIPGSINLPASFLTNAGINRAPATIMNKKILQDMVKGVGIPNDKNREIIVYCNTGQYAGMDYFVLHDLLGYKNVSVYDGSMMEYGIHDDLPLVRYAWGHVKQ